MQFSARRILVAFAITMTAAVPVSPQTAVEVHPAELAVPFGVASGRVVLVANHLVFVDESERDQSFAIPRSNIKSLEAEGQTVSITTRSPVSDQTGARSALQLRLDDAMPIARWYRAAKSEPATPTPEARTTDAGADRESFQARHDHRIGACQGNLIITPDRLIYESVDDIGDSRQWVFADIKEVDQDGPYRLEIVPFLGNTYNIELVGKGLDSAQFRQLVERITAARVKR